MVNSSLMFPLGSFHPYNWFMSLLKARNFVEEIIDVRYFGEIAKVGCLFAMICGAKIKEKESKRWPSLFYCINCSQRFNYSLCALKMYLPFLHNLFSSVPVKSLRSLRLFKPFFSHQYEFSSQCPECPCTDLHLVSCLSQLYLFWRCKLRKLTLSVCFQGVFPWWSRLGALVMSLVIFSNAFLQPQE